MPSPTATMVEIKSWHHERMVQLRISDTGGTRGIKIDGCHHRRIVRNEKIPVDCRKEDNQHIGEMPSAIPKGSKARIVAA